MREITDRQRMVLNFIVAFKAEYGYPPTIREIGKEMGIRSTNGVNDHLLALERKGWIGFPVSGYTARGIFLTKKTKKEYGIKVVSDSIREALEELALLVDNFPMSVDLKQCYGPMDGAKRVLNMVDRIIRRGLQEV